LFDTSHTYDFFSNGLFSVQDLKETERKVYPYVFFMDVKDEMENILQKWFSCYDDNR
jgi:hypothetical protein